MRTNITIIYEKSIFGNGFILLSK